MSVSRLSIGWTNTNFKADGFFLDHNPSDAVFLDDIIFQELTAAEQEDLRLHDLYGYVQMQTILEREYAS